MERKIRNQHQYHLCNVKRVLSLVLITTLLMSLTGCGSASKPEKVVTKFCDALKTLDMETASSCFASETDMKIDNPYTEEGGNDSNEKSVKYMKDNVKKMTYTIGESVVNDDIATIPVTFTYVDVSPIVSAALGDYISQAFALAFSGAEDSVTDDLFDTIFMEKTETVSAGTATSTVEFKCIKNDNEWKMQKLTDDVRYKINNIISGNTVEIMESLGSEDTEAVDNYSNNDTDFVWQDVPAGDVLELATVRMAIKECEEVKQLTGEYVEPCIAQEGTKFVVLTVEIENITKSIIEFNNDFMLYDSQEREYKNYSDALWYFDETFTYTELSPNIKTKGTLVYNVPEDAEGYYLVTGKSGTNDAYRLHAE